MIVRSIEKSLIDDIFAESYKGVLTPTYLGIFQKNTRDDVTSALENLDINTCINIAERDIYDDWFSQEIVDLHNRLLPLYKDGISVHEDNPYTYTARMMNAILKHMLIYTVVFSAEWDKFMQLLHPILTNQYLSAVPDLDTSQVNQIGGREEYIKLVKQYRDLMNMDLCEENKWMLNLKYGIDY